jgi:hypothetical protein
MKWLTILVTWLLCTGIVAEGVKNDADNLCYNRDQTFFNK